MTLCVQEFVKMSNSNSKCIDANFRRYILYSELKKMEQFAITFLSHLINFYKIYKTITKYIILFSLFPFSDNFLSHENKTI